MVFAGATSLLRLSLLVVIANLGISLASAQDQINEVHIQPRAEMSAPEALANQLSSALDTHTEPIRKQVDLVLVPVTITDPMDRIVIGLDSDNFRLYEGKQQQEIRHFSTEDAPVSLGILLDVSSSMKNKIERAREAVVEFLRAANQQDEFFMITFADRPQLLRDFTDAGEDAPLQGLLATPKGRTSLLDAIYLGFAQMRQAKYQRRALLVISDGGDNHSRYSEGEIRSLAKEANVAIYAIGIFDRFSPTQEELLGPRSSPNSRKSPGGGATPWITRTNFRLSHNASAWRCAISMFSPTARRSPRMMANGTRSGFGSDSPKGCRRFMYSPRPATTPRHADRKRTQGNSSRWSPSSW